jgi:general secretion pathway protein I
MQSNVGQRGFTLIEVLVALAILTLSLMIAIKVASEVTNSAIRLRDKTYAQWVALNKVAELRLLTTWPATGKSDGNTDMAGRSWHWTTEVKNTDDKSVRRLEVSVKPASEQDSAAPTVFVTAFLGQR